MAPTLGAIKAHAVVTLGKAWVPGMQQTFGKRLVLFPNGIVKRLFINNSHQNIPSQMQKE